MAEQDGSLALILGASRGLGLGLTREYLRRGWRVIATLRDEAADAARSDGLAALRRKTGERLEIVRADINEPDDVAALQPRLAGRMLDLLFVVAGISDGAAASVATISTERFGQIMLTNALSPLRAIEALAPAVRRPDGVIAAMSSGLGSVANNLTGGWEAYRASKAALDTLMRSFAARHQGDEFAILVVAPGWVRTDMGGPQATLDLETSTRGMADMIEARRSGRGAVFVDYRNQEVSW